MWITPRSTVCRLLGRWRRQAILEHGPDRILVRRPAAMEKLAGHRG